MSQIARKSSESATVLPATQYHYHDHGSLIDSPPAHVDTVLHR